MSYFEQPILMLLLGPAGSGKSYFARNMAEKINAVRINGDSMRIAMFGSREEIEKIHNSDNRNILNSYTFGGLDYVAEQILCRGYDVVYDAHHNKRHDRRALEKIAEKNKAMALVVWIKTPYDVALQRGQSREDTIDQRRLSEEKMRDVMDRHLATTEEPDDSERVILIGGQKPFDEQFVDFQNQVRVFL